jgi:hypothetical protein
MTPANAKKMLFTLRYPPDKILDIFEGSFSATASGSPPFTAFRVNSSFNHNLGLQPLLQMTYSLDGGTTWQDQHSTIPDLSTPNEPVFQTVDVGCYATSTQIVIVASNWTNSTRTVTYKVVAFV